MKIPLLPRPANRPRFALQQCAVLVSLGSLALSLLAQEPARSGTGTAVETGMGKPVPDFRAFREELNAQSLSPEQRIAAMDEWRKINGSPLARLRPEGSPSHAKETGAALIARQKQAALSAAKTDDERELAELQWEVAEAVDEMRSESVPPETRIRMFDEFHRANHEVFQEIRTLRQTVADRRRETAPPPVAAQPILRPPAEAVLLERRSALMQEIAAKRNAGERLAPEERIAALDRDRAFYQERGAALRELCRQLQTLTRVQTNDAISHPR